MDLGMVIGTAMLMFLMYLPLGTVYPLQDAHTR